MNSSSQKLLAQDKGQSNTSITGAEFSRLLPQNALHPTHYLYKLFHLLQEIASRNGYALKPGSRDFGIFRHAVIRLISFMTVLNSFSLWDDIVLPANIRDYLDDEVDISPLSRKQLLVSAKNAVRRKPITQKDCVFAMGKVGGVCSDLLFLFSIASLPEHGDDDEQFIVQRFKIAVYLDALGDFFEGYGQWDRLAEKMSRGSGKRENGRCRVQ